MTEILAVANQKGGVGKTTTTVNLAAFAAAGGRRVLLVDCDPQGNASSALGLTADAASAFTGAPPQATNVPNLSAIAAGADLIDIERKLAATEGRLALRQRLAPLMPQFDLVFIDCPPTLSFLPMNALSAADGLIIPLQCEYFAMEGLGQLLATVESLREEHHHDLAVVGILLTMFDERQSLSQQVAEEIRRHLGERVWKTAVPRDLALAAAPSHGKTILEYDPLSRGSLAYLAATKELLDGLR